MNLLKMYRDFVLSKIQTKLKEMPVCRKLNAALGMAEAGELQNIVKKDVFYGKTCVEDDILSEAGDVMFYLTWLLDEYKLTLEDAIHHNIHKLSSRYKEALTPEEFNMKEHSV